MAHRNRIYKGIGQRHLATEYGVHYFGPDQMLVAVGKTVWKHRCREALKMGVLAAVFVGGMVLGACL